MADDQVRAQVRAVAAMHHGVTRFGEALERSLGAARSEINRYGAEFQAAVVSSERALRDAERRAGEAAEAFARCENDCAGLGEAARKARAAEQAARMRRENNRRAMDRFERAAADVLSGVRSAEASMSSKIPGVKDLLTRHVQELNAYLATQVGN